MNRPEPIPLEQREMFHHFSDELLDEFSNYLNVVDYPDGTLLTEINSHFFDGKTAFLILLEGEVDVQSPQQDSTQVPIVRVMHPGEAIGLVSLREEVPHTATCVTRDASRVGHIYKEDLERIEKENPTLAAAIEFMIAHQLCRDLRMCNRRLANALAGGLAQQELPKFISR